MTSLMTFMDATRLATNTMLERGVFAEVRRDGKGWRVLAGGSPAGDAPWVNLWSSVHKAIRDKGDVRKIFWSELDRLVAIKDKNAIEAARDIAIEERNSSNGGGSFFRQAEVFDLREYSPDPDDVRRFL